MFVSYMCFFWGYRASEGPKQWSFLPMYGIGEKAGIIVRLSVQSWMHTLDVLLITYNYI